MFDSNSVYYFLNGNWIKINSGDQILFHETTGIYEVIRVKDGIPLFFDEHLERLQQSAILIQFNIWLSRQEIRKIILDLIKKNPIQNGNIKLELNRLEGSDQKNILCAFIPAYYPANELYTKGVESRFFYAERPLPNAKKSNIQLRNETNEVIKTNKLFDVILVNRQNQLTEGSRSNVFFIREEQVFTAPGGQVLDGITRQKVFKICHEHQIPIFETIITIKEISSFEAAFFSGTSPKILPISRIETIQFNPEVTLLQKLIKLYDLEIAHYINSAKN